MPEVLSLGSRVNPAKKFPSNSELFCTCRGAGDAAIDS